MSVIQKIAMPNFGMLYYPIPHVFNEEANAIYALVDPSDRTTTVLFGTIEGRESILTVLQSDKEVTMSFNDPNGWKVAFKPSNGLVVRTVPEARCMWDSLISKGWRVIPSIA